MTEEEKNNLVEKEIIKRIDCILDKANYLDFEGKKEYISFKREYLQDLFDLCKKQQKEIEEQHKQLVELTHSLVFDNISKNKVLKAMGYEENDEEYERIKQDDEKLLSILDTMYSEFCRLEDIEDKKVEVAVDFIEKRRDKHWQDKIRKRLEKLKEKEQELSDEQGYFGSSDLQAKIEELEELLEEQL